MTKATPDPTLAALIPQPSRRRNGALAALAVALLAGAWFAAPVLHPDLRQDAFGDIGPFKDVPASLIRVTAAGALTIERVTGTESTEVAGAWIVPDADGWARLTDEYSPSATPEDLLRASGINPDAAALPQSLADGETVWLMVAWHVTDCPTVDLTSWGDVTVRSPLGIERTLPLDGGGPVSVFDVCG